MNLLIPANGIFQPFFLRKAQAGFNLWAHIGFSDASVQVGHEDDCRYLLDQSSVDGVNIRELLFGFVPIADGIRRNRLAGIAEKHRGEICKKSFRLRYTNGFSLVQVLVGSSFCCSAVAPEDHVLAPHKKSIPKKTKRLPLRL